MTYDTLSNPFLARWASCGLLSTLAFWAPGAFAEGSSKVREERTETGDAKAPEAAPRTPGKESCAIAYEQGQRLRKREHLAEAHHEFKFCAQSACPAVLSRDCSEWLREVEADSPSVVFAVRDENGRDLGDTRIWIDGHLRGDQNGSTPLVLDPGPHTVRLERESAQSGVAAQVQEETLVVRLGEKSRLVAFTLRGSAPSPSVPSNPGPMEGRGEAFKREPGLEADGSAKAPPGPRTFKKALAEGLRRPEVVALGVLGLGGAASFAYFGFKGLGEEQALYGCRPNCASSDVDRARQHFVLADVSLGVSILSLVSGACLVAFAPPRIADSVQVSVVPLAGGRGFHGAVEARF